jgi:hypothetical protein
MNPERAKAGAIEDQLEKLRASIEKYATGHAEPTPTVVADLTKAIHDLSDHVESLLQRVQHIEDSHEEWTVHGWVPPPGSAIPPG